MMAVFGFLAPAVVVYAALTRPGRTHDSPISRSLGLALAPGLGVGVASCVHFALLLIRWSHALAFRFDLVFWTLALALVASDAATRRRRRSSDPALPRNSMRPSSWQPRVVLAACAFVLASVLAVLAFGVHLALLPHGEWDAWAIWNLRARALLRGAPDWAAVFSPEIAWSNLDYPLLVPLSIARLWAYAGTESTAVPMVIAATFLVGSVAVVVVSVGETRGWAAGLLSGTALLVSRTYVFQGGCQCADVPLAFFILVGIWGAAVAQQARDDSRCIFMVCGLAAALAAWTKNEGIVLLGLIALALAASPVTWARRRWAAVVFGALVPILALAFFKLRITGSSNYLFAPGAVAGISSRLGDPNRWSIVTASFARMIRSWGEISWGAVSVAAVAAAPTVRADRESITRALSALVVITALMIGYMLVYVITPLPLEWQIATSLPRLLTQLWPAFIWALFQLSDSRPRKHLE